jgi:hypothetical protein
MAVVGSPGSVIIPNSLANIRIAPKLIVMALAAGPIPGAPVSGASAPVAQTTGSLNNALLFSNPQVSSMTFGAVGMNQSTNGLQGFSSTSASTNLSIPHTPPGYLAPSNEKIKLNSDNGNVPSDSLWFPEIYISPETGDVSVLIVQNTVTPEPIQTLTDSSATDAFFSQEAHESFAGLSSMPEPDFVVSGEESQLAGVFLALGALWMAVVRTKDDERTPELRTQPE